MPMPPKNPIGRPPNRPSFWEQINKRIKQKRDVTQSVGANPGTRKQLKKLPRQ